MSTAFQEIASFKGAKDFHRMLRRRIYLPRVAADAVVRTLKYSRNPVQGSVRRRVAKIGPSQEQNDIPERDGYLFIEPDRFPLARVALDAARARFDDLSAAGAVEAARSNANKEFLLSIVHEGEFLDVPEIMSFMISRPVVDMATGYFGAVPVLSSARLWWTPPNATEQQSQLFHRDAEDYRQIKFFFNLFDVNEAMGPLTFLSADVSAVIMRRLGYKAGRLTDKAVDGAGGRGKYIVATGPADGGVAVDTSRCLHYGSRRNSAGRLVLMFQFTSFYAPGVKPPPWAGGIKRSGLNLDEVQKLVLGVA